MLRSRAVVLTVAAAAVVPTVAVAGLSRTAGPQLSVVTPRSGAVVEGRNVPTRIAVSGWRLDGMLAGKAPVPGVGHYHIHLDGRLVNAYGAPGAAVSLQDVAAGKHALSFVLARNDHSEVASSKTTRTFRYRPSSQPATAKPVTFPGAPSIRVVSPTNGAAAIGMVPLTVAVGNFKLSSALFGKLPVAGYGHWHVFLDEPAMPRMMAMTAGKTLAVSLKGVKPGKHTLIVMLADNLHAPISGAMATVTIDVK